MTTGVWQEKGSVRSIPFLIPGEQTRREPVSD